MDIDNDKYDYNTNDRIVTKLLVLDSEHRNTTLYPNTNNFQIDLEKVNQAPLRDVLAIKLIKFDIFGGGLALDKRSVYLRINDFNHSIVGTANINFAYANFITNSTGLNFHDTSSVLLETDPNVYTFNPVRGNLRKFDVSILNADGTLYDTKDHKVVMTFAIYSKRNKYTRN